MFDVFISHSSQDKELFVRPLAAKLKAQELSIWFDEDCIDAGDNILLAILSGIREAVCTVLIITENSWPGLWTWVESGMSLTERKLLVPVILGEAATTLAVKFPSIAGIKHITVKLNGDINSEIEKTALIITKRVNKLKKERLIPQAPIATNEAIARLNNMGIEKYCELVTFIRHFQNKTLDYNVAWLWVEKAFQWIVTELEKKHQQPLGPDSLEGCPHSVSINQDFNTNIIEHFKYLWKIQKIFLEVAEIAPDQFKRIEWSFLCILHWYISMYSVESPQSCQLVVIGPKKCTEEDIKETYHIETLVLRADLISDWGEALKWYRHNDHTCLGARDLASNKLVAFATILPVSDEWYQSFLAGKIRDNEIDLDDIEKYDCLGFYNLYISSVCVHPDYQGSNAFQIVFNAIMDMLIDLAQGEKFVNKIMAEASTDDGKRLCRFIGMEKVGESEHNTSIYQFGLVPPYPPSLRLQSRKGKYLIDYYKNRYSELRELMNE